MENSYEEHKRHTFDSFCKKILKNELRNYYKELNKRKKHEITFSDLSNKKIDEISVYDTYFADTHIFSVLNCDVIVKDESITQALKNLPEHKRDIILLSYFLDMSDREIADRLNMIRSTVQYRRKSILKELKKFMEGKHNE